MNKLFWSGFFESFERTGPTFLFIAAVVFFSLGHAELAQFTMLSVCAAALLHIKKYGG